MRRQSGWFSTPGLLVLGVACSFGPVRAQSNQCTVRVTSPVQEGVTSITGLLCQTDGPTTLLAQIKGHPEFDGAFDAKLNASAGTFRIDITNGSQGLPGDGKTLVLKQTFDKPEHPEKSKTTFLYIFPKPSLGAGVNTDNEKVKVVIRDLGDGSALTAVVQVIDGQGAVEFTHPVQAHELDIPVRGLAAKKKIAVQLRTADGRISEFDPITTVVPAPFKPAIHSIDAVLGFDTATVYFEPLPDGVEAEIAPEKKFLIAPHMLTPDEKKSGKAEIKLTKLINLPGEKLEMTLTTSEGKTTRLEAPVYWPRVQLPVLREGMNEVNGEADDRLGKVRVSIFYSAAAETSMSSPSGNLAEIAYVPVEKGKFSFRPRVPLWEGAYVMAHPVAPDSTPPYALRKWYDARIVQPIGITWGRVSAYLMSGAAISNKPNGGTDVDPFLNLMVDYTWFDRYYRYDRQTLASGAPPQLDESGYPTNLGHGGGFHWGIQGFTDLRFTPIGSLMPAGDPSKNPDLAVVQKSGGLFQAGIYVPFWWDRMDWQFRGDRYALFPAPLIKGGVIDSGDGFALDYKFLKDKDNPDGHLVPNQNTNTLKFYGWGARFGLAKLSRFSGIDPAIYHVPRPPAEGSGADASVDELVTAAANAARTLAESAGGAQASAQRRVKASSDALQRKLASLVAKRERLLQSRALLDLFGGSVCGVANPKKVGQLSEPVAGVQAAWFVLRTANGQDVCSGQTGDARAARGAAGQGTAPTKPTGVIGEARTAVEDAATAVSLLSRTVADEDSGAISSNPPGGPGNSNGTLSTQNANATRPDSSVDSAVTKIEAARAQLADLEGAVQTLSRVENQLDRGSQAPNNYHTAPELISYLDITFGRYPNYRRVVDAGALGYQENGVYGTITRRRMALEWRMRVPYSPFFLGFDANTAFFHGDREPSNFRVIFGLKIDVAAALNKVMPNVSPDLK